jgi:hypothetical protein
LNSVLDQIATRFGNRAVVTADLKKEKDSDDPRDGFYREEKRETAVKAEQQRTKTGPTVERDEE